MGGHHHHGQLATDMTARTPSTILITREEWLIMNQRSISTIAVTPHSSMRVTTEIVVPKTPHLFSVDRAF